MATDYLFIDGHYLREAYKASMQRFYGEVPEMDFQSLKARFGSASRVYYYDAIDRTLAGNEKESDRDARVKRMDDLHSYLNSLPRWHVREGFVTRGRKRRREQKAVDVQLAVDALEHAVARNIANATFVLGDLDFEPLFFSLNRFGVLVTVYFERGSASQDLLEAADQRYEMTIAEFFDMASEEFRNTHRRPGYNRSTQLPTGERLGQGTWNGQRVYGIRGSNGECFVYALPLDEDPSRGQLAVYPENDLTKASLAFSMIYGGEVEWT